MNKDILLAKERFELSQDSYDEFIYRRMLLEHGLVEEAGLRTGGLVEVFEDITNEIWITNPRPWIGEIKDIHPKDREDSLTDFLSRRPLHAPPKYADDNSQLQIIPLQDADASWYADSWGISYIKPRITTLPIQLNEVRLLEPYNPEAAERPPEIVRCPHCRIRISGLYAYKNGRHVCPSCLKPIDRHS